MDDGSPIRRAILAIQSAPADNADSNLLTYFLFFVVLMVFSGFFSGVETSLSVVNKIRMMSYADDGKKSAKRVFEQLGAKVFAFFPQSTYQPFPEFQSWANACSKSAFRSSISSIPTDRRTSSGLTPAATNCSSVN